MRLLINLLPPSLLFQKKNSDSRIELEYWPLYFKRSTTIVIPKPNKKSYNSPKSFRPIVLLNIVGKLIEKVIRERLQFNTTSK